MAYRGIGRVRKMMETRLAQQLKESSLDLSKEPETQPDVMTPWRKRYLTRRLRRTIPSPSTLASFKDQGTSKFWIHKSLNDSNYTDNADSKTDGLGQSIEQDIEFSAALAYLCECSHHKDTILSEVRNTYSKLRSDRLRAIELECKRRKLIEAAIVQYPMLLDNINRNNREQRLLYDSRYPKSTDLTTELTEDSSGIRMLVDQLPDDADIVDEDYEKYLKHHDIVQRIAQSQLTEDKDEYEHEVNAWASSVWHRNYGNSDPKIAPSQIPCSGCGAQLHCQDSGLPGFIPKQVFVSMVPKYLEDELGLKDEESRRYSLSGDNLRCQRCKFMEKYNVALKVSVPRENYAHVLTSIRRDPDAIVVLMVDLLDMPCSVWTGLLDIIGTSRSRKVFVVANKLDLLPTDGPDYIERVTDTVRKNLSRLRLANCLPSDINSGNGEHHQQRRDNAEDRNLHLSDVSVISAKTGFGVEALVTRLLDAADQLQANAHAYATSESIMERMSQSQGDDYSAQTWNDKFLKKSKETKIYLLGGTNVGKSTLFNALLQSDLCHERDTDLLSRVATTSPWPGTTLSTLAFPMARLRGWQQAKRKRRLILSLRNVKLLERTLHNHRIKRYDMPQMERLIERLGPEMKRQLAPRALDTMDECHPLRLLYGPHRTCANTSSASDVGPLNPRAKELPRTRMRPQGWVLDTPGTMTRDQIVELFTHKELMRLLVRETIVPRTFTLRPLQSILIGGVARVDVLTANYVVHLTVCASKYLPVHVVHTEHADAFYSTFVGSSMMGQVPSGEPKRLKDWPGLWSSPQAYARAMKMKAHDNECHNHEVAHQQQNENNESSLMKILTPQSDHYEPHHMHVRGHSWRRAATDIVLSSIGWVAVTLGPDTECLLRAFTPAGRGIMRRDPPLLSYVSRMRGRRIRGTPFFKSTGFEYIEGTHEGGSQFKINSK